MTDKRPPLSKGQRVRYIMYAVAVTVAVLAVVDGTLVWLDSQAKLDLTSANDTAWILYSDPWVNNGKGWYVTDSGTGPKGKLYDNPKQFVSAGRFRVKKGDAWRAFVLGASFIMGVPYPHVGSIPYWLRSELRGRYPRQEIELVNAAQSAQNARRVEEITNYALKHDPNLLIIASCNNEGALPPSLVTERLHRMGTFRLFRRLFRPDKKNPRPLHTPQDPDVEQVRTAYRNSIRTMIQSAKAKEIPVLLCTLPVNLRYNGLEAGLPIEGYNWDQDMRQKQAPCVLSGNEMLEQKAHDRAESIFRACDDVEALRGLGLVLYEQGKYTEARKVLEQYTELQPRNRCRPSFNQIIREEAQNQSHVHLVDLDLMAREMSKGGIPGPELFVDYCHMNWEAQGRVADKILDVMEAAKLGPKGPPVDPQLAPRKQIYERLKDEPPPPVEAL